MNEFVLVKGSNSVFMGTVAILSVDEWERDNTKAFSLWEEVMRGTWDEVNAVAKLMPEPTLRKHMNRS